MILHNGFHYTIEDSFNGFHFLKTTTPWFLLIENNNTMVSIQNKDNHIHFLFIRDNYEVTFVAYYFNLKDLST